MARILAVDWDQHEVRWILATPGGGGKLKIHAAVASPLVYRTGPGGQAEADLGGSLRAALAGHKIGRATTLVGVDRANVELLHLSLPPAKDAELPDMVLHQAMHESPLVTDEAALDFVSLDHDPAKPRRVLAAALPAEHLRQIRSALSAAGLKPRRMVLRSYALAALLAHTGSAAEHTCLLVSPLVDEADLIVVAGGKAVFLRTVRLPGPIQEEKGAQRLLAEIRRTLAVGLSEEPGAAPQSPPERIYICGGPGQHEDLAELIGRELSLPTEVFDTFAAVGAPSDTVDSRPGHFAALLGMVLDEAHGAAHVIDFLRPRRTSRPQSRQRRAVLAAAGAALVALAGTYYVWDSISVADADVLRKSRELRELNGLLRRAGQDRQIVSAVREWQAGDVNWLDELRDLSLRLPSARDMVLLRMAMTSARGGGGGDLDVQGVVRDQSIVDRMVSNIRDEYHRIYPKRVQERLPERAYSWHFIASMSVAKRDKGQYLGQAPEVAAGAQPAVADTGTTMPRKVRGARSLQAETP